MHIFVMIVWAAIYLSLLSTIVESLYNKEWKTVIVLIIITVLVYYIPSLFGINNIEMIKLAADMAG